MSQRPGRRRACPSLAVPMTTGDGLLVRLAPWRCGASAEQLVRLAELIDYYGSGDIDLTLRGNLQGRGFTSDSVRHFAAELDRFMPQPVVTPAVTLEPNAERSTQLLALRDQLVDRLAVEPLLLPPKCAVVVEEHGNYGIGALSADLRLRIADDGYWLGVSGSAFDAHWFHCVEQRAACLLDAGVALLTLLADGTFGQRGRELKKAEALASLLSPYGVTRALPDIHDEAVALGSRADHALLVAAPYGALSATTLKAVGEWCAEAQATLWPLPQRRLLLLPKKDVEPSCALHELSALGLITHSAEARLAISVCRGAPGCAAAQVPTRPLANRMAEVMAVSGKARPVHISGCAKGCARPNDAALCLVGTSTSTIAVVPNGLAYDEPAQQLSLTNGNLTREMCERLVQH